MFFQKLYSIALTGLACLAACSPAAATPDPSATFPLITLSPTQEPDTATPTREPVTATSTSTILPPTASDRPSPTATQPPPSETPTAIQTATPIAESYYDGTRVIFISTAGFLITVGDQRVLIDAIYQGYPGGVLKPILDAQPPFDGVDLVIATHEHLDHFDPELVLYYLQNNPETLFVSTPNVVDALLALDSSMRPRLTAVDLAAEERAQLELAEIKLEALNLSHGVPGLLNLSFIISMGGVTFFHTGDIDPTEVGVADFQAYGLPGKQIDIAFVPEFLFSEAEFQDHILQGIRAKHLFPMHGGMQPVSDLETIFPNSTLLQQPYESWVMP